MRRNGDTGRGDAQAKVGEISVEKKYQQDSLDVILLRQKYLEKEVSNLTDDMVSAVGMSFKRPKEQVLFLYPTLDLRPLDPLKVMKGIVMVDEEAMISPKLEHFPS